MKRKAICAALALCIAACLPLAACSGTGGDQGQFINPGDSLGGGGTATAPSEVESSADENEITSAGEEDLSDLLNASSYSGATALANGAAEITADGSYILSGGYTSVSIAKGLTVALFLNGAEIISDDGEALFSDKNCDVTLTLIGENKIESEGDNAVHIKGNLSINGDGTLSATSGTKSAIKASKSLKIAGAALVLSGGAHGAEAEDIAAYSASITVSSAAKDGLHAECDYDGEDASSCVFTTEKGFISLKDVTYACDVSGDGISADTFVYTDGGDLNIETSGEFVAKSSENMQLYGLTADDFRYSKSGSTYKKVDSDVMGSSSLYALKQSCKGIKAGYIEYDSDGDDEDDTTITDDTNYYIMICGGSIAISSTDDAVHANGGNITVADGTLTLNTSDDGLTADSLLKISGGTINVESSYEGLEGAYVEISGGTIDVTASDDGINAASELNPSDMHVIISDGYVTINADGDGIDSNGSILISGGDTAVYGPTNGGNAGLDSQSGIMVTGGKLFVSSALGMVETPATNSTQYVLSLATQSAMSSGASLTVEDSDGNEIYGITLLKSCRSVIISLPDFTKGKTYTVYVNGTQLSEFTISSIITSVGSTQNGGTGGNMNGGGMNGGGMNGGHGGMGGGGRR